MIERACHKLAARVGDALHHNAEQQAVMTYGLIALVQMCAITVLVIVVGSLLGVGRAALVVSITVGLLRKSTGGRHAQSLERCIALSVCVCVALAYLCVCLPVWWSPGALYAAMGIALLLGLLAFVCKVPVGSPQKPIRSEQKRKRMRRQTWLGWGICSLLCACCCVLGAVYTGTWYIYGLAIALSVLWQAATLVV